MKRTVVALLAVSCVLTVPVATKGAAKTRHKPHCTITGSDDRHDILRGTPRRDVICGRGGDTPANTRLTCSGRSVEADAVPDEPPEVVLGHLSGVAAEPVVYEQAVVVAVRDDCVP
jgi:hypothetical protein